MTKLIEANSLSVMTLMAEIEARITIGAFRMFRQLLLPLKCTLHEKRDF